MNITAFWPKESVALSIDAVHDLIQMRFETFMGFVALEKEKGFIQPSVRYSTSHGQETARLLLFRFLEEMAESAMAEDPNHMKEEIIDAINYLWAFCLLDHTSLNRDRVENIILSCAKQVWVSPNEYRPVGASEMGMLTVLVAGELADTFRNRAWMHNAQDIVWAGSTKFYSLFTRVLHLILPYFATWDEFWKFYVAKDRVLQFRLQTDY